MDGFFGAGWEVDPHRRVIYNGIDDSRFAPRRARARVRDELGIGRRQPLVAHVANFTAAKNHAGLMAIAAATIARRPDVVFVLVGDGPMRAEIAADVAHRGLAHAVRFAGPRDDVPRILGAADVFVFPSLWEGFPGAVLEALASGLPVVASPIPSILEIARHMPAAPAVDGASAAPAPLVTVDPAEPDTFGAAIIALLPSASGMVDGVPDGAGAAADDTPSSADAGAAFARLPRPFTVEASIEGLLACYG
ncbi:MAG: glycosyltransferase [Deltaproteobacteria bacterium]|nr:glycosyltransferase [Deltaproteobacteria bacterium]